MSLNHITIMGRLVKDPELRTTVSGVNVAKFTVAVDRDFGEDKTDFIDCAAWRKTGEFVTKYFTKGRMIIVDGSLHSSKWEDRDGNKRTGWEIDVDSVYFGDSPKKSAKPVDSGLTELGDDEGGELPWADGDDDLPL